MGDTEIVARPGPARLSAADAERVRVLGESLIDLDAEADDLQADLRRIVQQLLTNRDRRTWTRVELESIFLVAGVETVA